MDISDLSAAEVERLEKFLREMRATHSQRDNVPDESLVVCPDCGDNLKATVYLLIECWASQRKFNKTALRALDFRTVGARIEMLTCYSCGWFWTRNRPKKGD